MNKVITTKILNLHFIGSKLNTALDLSHESHVDR